MTYFSVGQEHGAKTPWLNVRFHNLIFRACLPQWCALASRAVHWPITGLVTLERNWHIASFILTLTFDFTSPLPTQEATAEPESAVSSNSFSMTPSLTSCFPKKIKIVYTFIIGTDPAEWQLVNCDSSLIARRKVLPF